MVDANSLIVGTTRGGKEWTPEFITSLDASACLGCGRCYNVCPRDVFELVDKADIADQLDDDDYDDDFDYGEAVKVMSIRDAMDCIGCSSCYKVCPKKCHSHEAVAA